MLLNSSLRKYLFTIFLFLPLLSIAQDTIVVQTLTYDSITTRRGVWEFPEAQNWRKVLMYHTLKCDPATTQDGFNCGEWDYITNTRIYKHDGEFDSTYQSRYNFTVAGSTPDSLAYTNTPTYTYYQSVLEEVIYDEVLSFDSTIIGTGSDLITSALALDEQAGRSQFIWTESELSSAGLTAGPITGLRFDLVSLGSTINNLKIKLGHTTTDSLDNAFLDGLTQVYHNFRNFGETGWQDIQFTGEFEWNGTDNIVVEISFDGDEPGLPYSLYGSTLSWPAGLSAAGADHAIRFSGAGQHVNLGDYAQVSGANPRTIEAWAYTENFNNGGIFQAGPTGSSGKDFSLRTMTADDNWRVQLWGTPDFDAVLPGSKNSWHHYAVTYDGSVARLYYDGVFQAQENAALSTDMHDIWIGRWSGSYFNGLIDEVRVWDTALPESTLGEWAARELDDTHPDWANLEGLYRFDEGAGVNTADSSPEAHPDGILTNIPWWEKIPADQLFKNLQIEYTRPNIIFEQGEYTSTIEISTILDSIMNAPVMVVLYDNPADGTQVEDESSIHPNLPTDTLIVWRASEYVYTLMEGTGELIDSSWVNADEMIIKTLKEWYSPNVTYEIARFITPYGIGLDLGNEGFTWVYDITDYAFLLTDSVDLSSGNQQELIDLKFVFIEGTPARDFIKMDRIWGSQSSYRYDNLDDDVSLSARTIDLHPDAASFKVRSRLSGHGHNSNTGSYPHCCEWKDNVHYLLVNGTPFKSWHIFQYNDCALNPVYPQGGTWLGSREGWCPGDIVDDTEVEITEAVIGNTVSIDYSITPVPLTNEGMGGGNYVMAWHLMQYGALNFTLDAELYDVISPNKWEYRSRKNPMCLDPQVVIRNSGSETLTSLDITYGVSGAWEETYEWTGMLDFMDKELVTLPVPGSYFWDGDDSRIFTATVRNPNGAADGNPENDSYQTEFELPDLIETDFYIQIRTNNYPSENSLTVKNDLGEVIYFKNDYEANSLYSDTFMLEDGCYTIEFLDTGNDGLSYWADPTSGSGFLRLRDVFGPVIKTFEAEFGRTIFYAFRIGELGTDIEEPLVSQEISIYPNPSNGNFYLELEGYEGEHFMELSNLNGQVVYTERINAGSYFLKSFSVPGLVPGYYLLRLSNTDQIITRKIIVH